MQSHVEIAETEEITEAPRIAVRVGSGKPTQSKAVKEAVRQSQQQIYRAVDRRLAEIERQRRIDREIAILMAKKLAEEEDEEEAILALLLY